MPRRILGPSLPPRAPRGRRRERLDAAKQSLGGSGSAFAYIQFRDSFFLGNDFPVDILVDGVARVRFERVVVQKPPHTPLEGEEGPPVFLGAWREVGKVTFDDCLLYLDSPVNLASMAGDASNSRVLTASDAEIPEGMTVEGIERRELDIEALNSLLEDLLARGLPSAAEGRERLERLLTAGISD